MFLLKLNMFLKLNKLSSSGMLEEEGGGEQQATCYVAKQAVEFPQILARKMQKWYWLEVQLPLSESLHLHIL